MSDQINQDRGFVLCGRAAARVAADLSNRTREATTTATAIKAFCSWPVSWMDTALRVTIRELGEHIKREDPVEKMDKGIRQAFCVSTSPFEGKR
jgi:hypothetical protein